MAVYIGTVYCLSAHKVAWSLVPDPAVIGLLMWTLHFGRRLLETLFLFDFSGTSVPPADSLAEFLYYWLFAFLIARDLALNEQLTASTSWVWQTRLMVAQLLWLMAEFGNFACHLSLRKIKDKRKANGLPRSFPPEHTPYLFGHVACPHYTFEVLSWALFNLCSGITIPGTVSSGHLCCSVLCFS